MRPVRKKEANEVVKTEYYTKTTDILLWRRRLVGLRIYVTESKNLPIINEITDQDITNNNTGDIFVIVYEPIWAHEKFLSATQCLFLKKNLIDNFYSSEDREIKYLVSIAVYVAYLLVHSFAILSCSSLKNGSIYLMK